MKLLFALFILIPTVIFGQDTDSTKSSELSIGFTLSPDYCYRTLKPDASYKWIADSRDSYELPKPGYTTGFNLLLRLNKRIALETGLLFSDKGKKTNNLAMNWMNPSSQLPPQPTKAVLIYHYYYISVPVKMNYYILDRRVKVFLSAGISANIFLTEGVTSLLQYDNGGTARYISYQDNGFSRINPSFTGGIGFSYELTNKLFFVIQPLYNHSIISIADSRIKEYLYSLGLTTGIYFKF